MQALQEYKCPCCGGALAFDSSVQKMKCPFCDTEFAVEALESYDEVLSGKSPPAANGKAARRRDCVHIYANPAEAKFWATKTPPPQPARSAATESL